MNANTLLADPAAIRIEKFVSFDDSVLIVVETFNRQRFVRSAVSRPVL